MIKSKAAGLAVAAAAAAAALSVAVASPASAATTSNGCTVAPLKPVFAGFNSSGVKLVNYRISVNCLPGRTALIEQERYEQDPFPNPDDPTGNNRFSASNVVTIPVIRPLPDTEIGAEEIYHQVRFRVTSNGVTSPPTAFESSPVLPITN